jgi:hypothetical protein
VNVHIVSVIFGSVFLIIVIFLIRKGILHIKYSLLWFLLGLILLFLSLSPKFVDAFAHFLDIKNPPSLLFLLGLLFLLAYSLHLSAAVSEQSGKIIRLSQEIALLMKQNPANVNDMLQKNKLPGPGKIQKNK